VSVVPPDLSANLSDILPDGDFVIADLEYTAWEGAQRRDWSGPGEFREIVQIGAVRVSADGWREDAAFAALVQPTLNPVLSGYFIDLTGITNDDIAREVVPVADALRAFHDFTGGLPVLSHGRDDTVVSGECAKKGLADPFAGHDWRDIAPAIRAVTGQVLMSSDLPGHFGLEMPGRAHDALADSRALRRVLAHLADTGAI